MIDGRQVRIDWDPGFKYGRQFGRGKTGGQVRDEINTEYADKDRPHYVSKRGGMRGGSYSSGRNNTGYRGYKRGRDEDADDHDDYNKKRYKRYDQE